MSAQVEGTSKIHDEEDKNISQGVCRIRKGSLVWEANLLPLGHHHTQ